MRLGAAPRAARTTVMEAILVSPLRSDHLGTMPRRAPVNPFAAYAWLAEAGWVFMMHSARLLAEPTTANARLAALATEKQRAFAEGAIRAGAAVMRGAKPEVIANAAMAPARRRVRANARKLHNG